MKRVAYFLLILSACLLFGLVLSTTRNRIGETFPGFLQFENGIVGAYYVPGWPGEALGVSYHDGPPLTPKAVQTTFSRIDYAWIVLVPAISGLLFFLLGVLVCSYLPDDRGRGPLLIFHFLVGLYLIFSPDFHLTYRFVYPHLAAFAFIPAAMLHFSLLFPEEAPSLRKFRALTAFPYLASAALLIPYAFLFRDHLRAWIATEYIVVFYVSASYLFWVIRLVRTLRRPQFEANRIVARYLFLGQLVAFTVPFFAAVAVFIGGFSFPLNFAAPVTLLFPASLFVGTVLARLKQSQMRLVQTEKMATVGNLLSGLAHELKNPLNFIIANLDALRERAKTQDVREIVDDMEEGAERVRNLLEDFRFIADPRRSRDELVDLNEVVRRSAGLLKPRCGDRVMLALQLNEIPKIRGASGELGQAVLNLVANAIESIEGEGEVAVTTSSNGREVRISVRDTGAGIPRENLPRIFDPFFTTKPQGEGTGLGLAIVQQVVKNHGGTIEVRSEEGKGSEFVVMMPKNEQRIT